jgi:hypothetical protein
MIYVKINNLSLMSSKKCQTVTFFGSKRFLMICKMFLFVVKAIKMNKKAFGIIKPLFEHQITPKLQFLQ